MADVVVLTMSEFGRTVAENGAGARRPRLIGDLTL
jgi:uncharacterized protein (DUF1501 family)